VSAFVALQPRRIPAPSSRLGTHLNASQSRQRWLLEVALRQLIFDMNASDIKIKNTFWSHPRLWMTLWVVIIGLVGSSTVAPVMRESDQASLLDGSLTLAREWKPQGQQFYNYDKQWLSYWILSSGTRVLIKDENASLSDFVELGNYLAFFIAWGGVGLALIICAGRNWTACCISAMLTLSPVWLLSQSLLSSNIISAGFLGTWIIAMELAKKAKIKRKNIYPVICGLCAFLAVGCRADAVLVLPAWAIAWWGVGRDWRNIWKEKALYWSVLGATVALLVGRYLDASIDSSYDAFFQLETFIGYLVFGLGGIILIYVAALISVIFTKKKRDQKWFLELIWVLLLLLPLMYYGRLLFTPRHLTTAALVITLSACFSGSHSWWRGLLKGHTKWIISFAIVLLVLPLGLGIQLHSLRSGRLVVQDSATLYPTADGLWPIGSYAQFIKDLSQADEITIDHNQRVWGAWLNVFPKDLPEGKIHIISKGLTSYGELWACWHNRELLGREAKGSMKGLVMFDSRSLIKDHKLKSQNVPPWFYEIEGVTSLSIFDNERILLARPDSEDIDRTLEVARAIRENAQSSRMLIVPIDQVKSLITDSKCVYEWLILEAESGAIKGGLSYRVIKGTGAAFASKLSPIKKGWAVRSELPVFFRRENY
jgi:hypothetical protein